MALIAQNQRLKRSKSETRRVNTPATDPKFRAQRKAASERWRLKKKAKEKK